MKIFEIVYKKRSIAIGFIVYGDRGAKCKIKMEEGAIRRLVWNAIADMHWKKAKGHGIVYIGREMPRFCRR